MNSRKKRDQGFFHEHSLSLVAAAILGTWILLYWRSNPATHLGSFFGNAIADWTGLVVAILATKGLFEAGSAESKIPPKHYLAPISDFVMRHSLSIFLAITGVAWIVLFARVDAQGKWGQVVGNIVSEWTQLLGMVLLSKKLIERGSKESKDG
jgi:hypothetical protein